MSGGIVGQIYYNSEDPKAVPRNRQKLKVDIKAIHGHTSEENSYITFRKRDAK